MEGDELQAGWEFLPLLFPSCHLQRFTALHGRIWRFIQLVGYGCFEKRLPQVLLAPRE
jgi:hypothetical protein